MLRRLQILGIILLVIGVGSIAAGIASATAWKGAEEIRATLDSPNAAVIEIPANVFATAGDDVQFLASAPELREFDTSDAPSGDGTDAPSESPADAPSESPSDTQSAEDTSDTPTDDDPDINTPASGPGADIFAVWVPDYEAENWLGDARRVKITGLSSFTELRSETIEGEETVPNPRGFDIWPQPIESQGTLELTAFDVQSRQVLLVMTDGSHAAPAITMVWPRSVSTPWLWPLVIVGVVLVAGGIFTFYVVIEEKRRRQRRAERQARRLKRIKELEQAETEIIPIVTSGPGVDAAREEAAEAAAAQNAALAQSDFAKDSADVDPAEGPSPDADGDGDDSQESDDQTDAAHGDEVGEAGAEEGADQSADAGADARADEGGDDGEMIAVDSGSIPTFAPKTKTLDPFSAAAAAAAAEREAAGAEREAAGNDTSTHGDASDDAADGDGPEDAPEDAPDGGQDGDDRERGDDEDFVPTPTRVASPYDDPAHDQGGKAGEDHAADGEEPGEDHTESSAPSDGSSWRELWGVAHIEKATEENNDGEHQEGEARD